MIVDDAVKQCTLVIGKFIDLQISKSGEEDPYCATCEKLDYSSTEYHSIYRVLEDFNTFHDETTITAIVYKGYILPLSITEDTWTNSVFASCEEINFQATTYLSYFLRLFPIKVDEYLKENQMSTINYEGYELVISPYNHALFSGECKELKYYRGAVSLSWLHSDFVKTVDNKKKTTEHTMTYKGYELHVTARQFALIKSSYDLDKECVPDSSNTYCGECKEIGFKLYLCVSVGTLIKRFKEFVDELESKPEQKEYQGYIYFIEKPDPRNAWYVGTSLLQGESWRRESSTKEEIEREFKQEIDERLKLVKIFLS